MTPEQFDKVLISIKEQVSISIDAKVNGNIRRLDQKMDDYIKSDNEWKQSVTPSIETMKRVEGFGSTGLYLLKAIIALGAAGTVVLTIINWLRK